MQKIIPFFWFNNQAEEAAKFYVSNFKNSRLGNISRYDDASAEVSGKAKDSVMTVDFELEGQTFSALNGGPEFKFSPAVSFSVHCESAQEVDEFWARFVPGGKVLMELDKYPFSERYGWLEDKYGVSWQFNFSASEQKIVPSLLFVGRQFGQAENAIKLYTSLIDNSRIGEIIRYEAGEGDQVGAIKYSTFFLGGQKFIAMESSMDHKFEFSQASSFLINCKTQEEVDRLWDGLSGGGEKQPCGWLRDKHGVTWQVVPTILNELLNDPDKERAKRAMKAMLKMTKIVINDLKEAVEKN